MRWVLVVCVALLAGCAAPPGLTIDDPTVGDAPIVAHLFLDYQCPHCHEFEASAAGDHLDGYVQNGSITLVHRIVAFVGGQEGDSLHAARVSLCAYAIQPSLWPSLHAAIFGAQGQPNDGWASAQNMRSIAVTVGIDGAQLDSCLHQNAHDLDARIRGATDELLVTWRAGTPALVVGETLVNPNDTAAVDAAIAA